MKHLFSLSFLILITASLVAQDSMQTKKRKIVFGDGMYFRDSTWKVGGFAAINLSQTAVHQWAAGGNNSFAFLLSGNLYVNYKKGKWISDNSLDIKWGMVANGLIRKPELAKRNFQKNVDQFQIKLTGGYAISKVLFAAVKIGFETQLTPTYDYSQTDTSNGRFRRYTVSRIVAPAVLTIGPGLTYKPVEYFTLFFSPVEGKMTFVKYDHIRKDTTTAADGTYTDNYYSDVDETRYGMLAGEKVMAELGAELDILFQKDIIKNVNLKTHLNIFETYINRNYNTAIPSYDESLNLPANRMIDPKTKHIPVVKWETDMILKINKYLSAMLTARFIYQYNATVPIDEVNNQTGGKGADGNSDKWADGSPKLSHNRIQIFEQFGLGLAYKF